MQSATLAMNSPCRAAPPSSRMLRSRPLDGGARVPTKVSTSTRSGATITTGRRRAAVVSAAAAAADDEGTGNAGGGSSSAESTLSALDSLLGTTPGENEDDDDDSFDEEGPAVIKVPLLWVTMPAGLHAHSLPGVTRLVT
jgi:hypothetical protein